MKFVVYVNNISIRCKLHVLLAANSNAYCMEQLSHLAANFKSTKTSTDADGSARRCLTPDQSSHCIYKAGRRVLSTLPIVLRFRPHYGVFPGKLRNQSVNVWQTALMNLSSCVNLHIYF